MAARERKLTLAEMQKIGPPDSHHLSAAIGWLGLGLREEAIKELDLISPSHQEHLAVLEARWTIYAEERRWDAALEVARQLLTKAPNHAEGWLHHAYALRRVAGGGLAKAWEALRPAADRFPKVSVIPYNLSCYACQMQQLDEARVWFKRAIKIGGREEIKQMALADTDLEPLWDEIRQL